VETLVSSIKNKPLSDQALAAAFARPYVRRRRPGRSCSAAQQAFFFEAQIQNGAENREIND